MAGLPAQEIAVVLVSNDRIIDRYQSLMNPCVPIPHEIQALTALTGRGMNPNVRMLRKLKCQNHYNLHS